MFPFRDHNPSLTTPLVTWGLIALNILVFASYFPLFADPVALRTYFETWGIVPAAVTGGEGYAPLLTSMFLHGGILHLAGNMLFLYIFGDNLEDALGHVGFLLFYLLCGCAAGLMQVLADPASGVPVVGASGAIAGVMGGYLLLYPRALVDILIFIVIYVRVISLPAWTMLGIWFAIQVVAGATSSATTDGVAYWAHAGGFVAGFVICLPVWLRRGRGAWGENGGRPPYPETRYARSGIPRVPRRKGRRGPWG